MTARDRPARFQNLATGLDLVFYAARSCSLRTPRTGRRLSASGRGRRQGDRAAPAPATWPATPPALCLIAAEAERGLFERNPGGAGRYAGRLLCRALCQGAALHYVDGMTGIKDFDIWSFYSQHDDGPFRYRWRGTADFGPSKFGWYPQDLPAFLGRRVDLRGRSLPVGPSADPVAALREYLSSAHSSTAKALADKAVVLIDPTDHLGQIVWPPHATNTR